MSVHLQREIENLKKAILSLSGKVEENLWRAVESLEEKDADLASRVVDYDAEIDRGEVAVEEECLKILALHQPVAYDLRFIIAVLKINNDVERVGDKAVSIARRTLSLSRRPLPNLDFEFMPIADKARGMLKKSLDALVKADTALAREVRAEDEQVDALDHDICARIEAIMRQRPEDLDILLLYRGVTGNLERVADLATNIAEEVIYMVEGEIIRHKEER